MRDMSKFSRTAAGISKKAVAIAIAFAMSLPNAAYANNVTANYQTAQYEEEFEDTEEFHADHMQEILDEAEAMGVPNAFIRHYLASDLEEGKIAKPAKALKIKNATNAEGVVGLSTGKVNLATLANTKIDLGKFDFGEYSPANLVYNFAAGKKVKGKVYFYLDGSDEAFAEGVVKRSNDDPWAKTKSLAIDVRDLKLTGEKQISMKFVADSVLNGDGTINSAATDEGKIYIESLFFTESSTPVVSFDIDKEVNTVDSINGSSVHSTMGYGMMNISVPEGYVSPVSKNVVTDKTYELDYIRGRGNSTWLQSKKPYKVKLENSEEILGMPANKHWALLANYFDYTLLRNRYTFYLAEKLGLDYTPNSVAVDVVMDGEYYGSYQLSETVRIDENRIEIDDLEEEENPTDPDKITGGYLLSHGSGWLKGESLPTVGNGDTRLCVEKPEYDSNTDEEVKQAELDYMGDYLAQIDEAVANAGSNEEGVVDWRTLLDEDSLITYTLMQDFTDNGDAYSGSTYYYKPRNDKLYCGPVWDFDFVAWGAYDTAYSDFEGFGMSKEAPWFTELYGKDEKFRENVVKKWNEFSALLKDSAKDEGYLDEMARGTYMSALANYQAVSSYLIDGINYWSWEEDEHFECYDEDGNPYTLNYFNEVNRLKAFATRRAAWFDENIEDMSSNYNNNDDYKFELYVDDKLYATVSVDDFGVIKKMPEEPKKDGYAFLGWFAKTQDGNEIELNSDISMVTYVYDDELKTKIPAPRKYYAKFVKTSDVKEIESLKFTKDTLYVPLYFDDEFAYKFYDGEYGDDVFEGEYQREVVKLRRFLVVKPDDMLKKNVKWELVDEKGNPIVTEGATLKEEGVVDISALGTYYVKASYKNLSATIKLVAFDSSEEVYPTKITATKSLDMEVGDTSNIEVKFDKEEKVSYALYDKCKYIVADEDIVKVDELGKVTAKKAGVTSVITMLDLDYETGATLVASTKINVSPNAKDIKSADKSVAPKAGTVLKDKAFTYKVTKAASDDKKVAGEVALTGLVKKNIKKATVKGSVVIDGYKYNVTSIGAKAFAKAKKLTKVTIGKNVKTIGAKAFFGLKKLKSVSIKSKNITKIGKKAFFRKGGKKVTFKVVKAKKKAYKKLLKNAKTNKYKVK